MTERFGMLGRLLCWVGWHSWTWKMKWPIMLGSPPPNYPECDRCGLRFKDYD